MDAIELVLVGKVHATATGVPTAKSLYKVGEVKFKDDETGNDVLFHLHISPTPTMLTPSSDAFVPGWCVHAVKPKEKKTSDEQEPRSPCRPCRSAPFRR